LVVRTAPAITFSNWCRPSQVLDRELHHLQELSRADLPAAQPVPGDGGHGEPGHQRPVQVEERADTRARRARVDLGHGARQGAAGRS